MNPIKDNKGVERTTTTLPSGKEIPVYVHPVNNGVSANNVDIKDMSAQNEGVYMTLEEYECRRKKDIERESLNRVELRFDLLSKREHQGGVKYQMIDGKKSDVPMVDDEGNMLRYPSKFFITGTTSGATPELGVTPELYNSLVVGDSYILKGRMGTVRNFGEDKFEFIPMSFEYR